LKRLNNGPEGLIAGECYEEGKRPIRQKSPVLVLLVRSQRRGERRKGPVKRRPAEGVRPLGGGVGGEVYQRGSQQVGEVKSWE